MESGDVFTKVDVKEELDRVLRFLLEHRVSISGHSELGTRFTLSPVEILDKSLKVQVNSSAPIGESEFISVVFQVLDESFFLRTKLKSLIGNEGVADFSEPLFKLQRRQYSRVKATQIKGSIFKVVSVNGELMGDSYNLVDLSGGGISVEIRKLHAGTPKVGDRISGRIVIPGRADEIVSGIVKHCRQAINGDQEEITRFGIQFIDLTPKQQQRTLQIVFDIYREIADQTFKILDHT